MKKLVIFILLALLLTFGATPAYAVPALPHAFYGSVTINGGSAAPDDTQISATVESGDIVAIQNPVPTLGDSYGIESPKLLVQGDGLSGAITFYVNGIIVEGATATFEAGGGPTKMDLVLEITDESITGEVEETIPTPQTDYVVDASDVADTTIIVDTTAEVTITVKKYYSNPHPDATPPADTEMLPRYIDIDVDNPAAIEWPMYVEQSYTDDEVAGLDESSLGMCYFTVDPEPDGAWHRCSDTGVDTVANYVWANIEENELPGCPVAIGGAVAVEPEPEPEPEPTPRPSGGGIATRPVTPAGTTDVRGQVSDAGVFLESVSAASEDGLCTLTIPEDTVGLTGDLEPLTEITTLLMDEPPPPPEDAHVIGLAYDLGPDGATFEPPITLTFSYDPSDIPEGIAEEDLVIAYYDQAAGEWVELEDCVVDTENNTITASVSHFTTFTIIGAVAPPPEEEEIAPPEEEEVAPPEEEEIAPPEEEEIAPTPPVPPAPPTEPEEVEEVPALEVNWPLIAGTIAAGVVIAVILFFLVRRRKQVTTQ